jgi:hypothetical protein
MVKFPASHSIDFNIWNIPNAAQKKHPRKANAGRLCILEICNKHNFKKLKTTNYVI